MPTVNIERLRKLDYRCNEAYKTLRTNIQLCGSDMKVIMFTSSTPNEGKSSVSFNPVSYTHLKCCTFCRCGVSAK